jgi:hypothetical protein
VASIGEAFPIRQPIVDHAGEPTGTVAQTIETCGGDLMTPIVANATLIV